ncbi:hypothetical protein OH76DRAFT_1030193 [Lentinus brumalis]|uniref:Uncharacterized protein n=1 Tax=Lentinus brumalis TaxID=2498619 RepID=A0A371CXC6_9APHY|nr:hypothetical protein OH76DRAFT_1030193 [Polyporus brumalis]
MPKRKNVDSRGVVGEVLGRGGDHAGSGSQAGGEKRRSANEPSGGQNVAGSSSLAHSHNNFSRDSEAGHNPVGIRPWPTLEAPNMPYNVSRISQTPQHIAYHTHTTPLPPSLAGASQGYGIGMHHPTWTPYSMAPSPLMELFYRLQRIELEVINLRQSHANMAVELADLRRRTGFGPSSKIDNLGDTQSSGPAARLQQQTKRPKNTNASAVVPSKRGHEEDGVTVVPSKKSKDGSSPGSLAPLLQDKGKGRVVSSLNDLIVEDNS